MGVMSFFTKVKRTLSIATKPDLDTFIDSMKITLLGLGVVGIITYLIHLLSFAIQLRPG
jgi:protein translocase SEC61 complex gamma subunit